VATAKKVDGGRADCTMRKCFLLPSMGQENIVRKAIDKMVRGRGYGRTCLLLSGEHSFSRAILLCKPSRIGPFEEAALLEPLRALVRRGRGTRKWRVAADTSESVVIIGRPGRVCLCI